MLRSEVQGQRDGESKGREVGQGQGIERVEDILPEEVINA